MLIELIAILVTLLAIQVYFVMIQKYSLYQSLKNRGIPFPKSNYFLGNLLDFYQVKDKNELIGKWLKQYGNIVGYVLGHQKWIVVNDIDLLQELYVKNSRLVRNREGFTLDIKYINYSIMALRDDRWNMVRKKITPSFACHKNDHTSFKNVFQECIDNLVNHLRTLCMKGSKENCKELATTDDIYKKMQAFTIDVITRTAFGMNEDVYDPNSYLMSNINGFFKDFNSFAVDLCYLFPSWRRFLSYIHSHLANAKLTQALVQILKEHIKTNLLPKSRANQNRDKKSIKSVFLQSFLQKLTEKEITEDEFFGNLFGIFLAGYETTANGATFALYLLAKHPDIQDKLREDLKKNGYESKYLDQVWCEALRVYPPVCWFINREISEDITINGVEFVKNDVIQIPIWDIHHNPAIWSNPYKFDPERFTEENKAAMHPCQFLAFGLGPRKCIGASFADLEAKMLLSALILNFRIEATDETPQNLKLTMPVVVNNPAEPLNLKIVML